MDQIFYNVGDDFPFEDLSLKTPRSMQGGGYFSKLKINEDEVILFQTPKCLTKKGILKTGKKMYCDLLFSEDNNKFISWFQKLEKRIHNLIYENREDWFDNTLTLDDIDYLFNSSLRTYRGTKYLVRCFVKQPKYIKNDNVLRIYDENENELTLDDITKEVNLMSIIEVLGIKYTNGGTSFTLELCLRQIMTFSNKNMFEKCLIHKKMISAEENELKPDASPVVRLVKKNPDEVTPDEGELGEENIEENPDAETMVKMPVENDEVKINLGGERRSKKLTIEPDKKPETLVNLEEVQIELPEKEEEIKLKKASDVYFKLWRQAREKAKCAKKEAIEAFLEAKNIKNTYLLDVESSDEEMDF